MPFVPTPAVVLSAFAPARVAVAAFEEARRSVARAVQLVMTFVGLPIMIWALAAGGIEPVQLPWVWGQFVGVLIGSAIPSVLRQFGGSERLTRAALLGALWVVVLTSLLANGNGFGGGVLYIAWALAMVFFEQSWMLTSVLGSTMVTIVLAGARAQWFNVSWSAHVPEWTPMIRLIIMTLTATAGVTWMLSLVLTRLRDAIDSETAARAREMHAHAEREAALESAQRGQRLESLGRLSGGVAHDFNNSLAVLSMGLETLDEPLDDAERADIVDSMRRALKGAESTTRQLLAFSRRGVRGDGSARPTQLLSAMTRTLERLFPETIQFTLDLAETPAVPFSAGELEQVVLNLCLNARDAMPNGGVITLRSRVDDTDVQRPVQIDVIDTGHGMATDVLAHAFEPFFTTKDSGRGTGLGLSMVHGMITQRGGHVTIDTTVARGTTVRLSLPALVAHESADGHASAETRDARAARILLVEDEEALARMLTRALTRGGYEVLSARTIADGESLLHTHRSFDLLLTDGVLPDGGPWHLIEQFRQLSPNRPVLVCSGYVPEPAILAEIEAARCAFLAKPFGVKELVARVDTLLAGTSGHL